MNWLHRYRGDSAVLLLYGFLVALFVVTIGLIVSARLVLGFLGVIFLLSVAFSLYFAVDEFAKKKNISAALSSLYVAIPLSFFCFMILTIGLLPLAGASLVEGQYRRLLRAAYRIQEKRSPVHVTSRQQLERLRPGRKFYFTAQLSSAFRSEHDLVYYRSQEYRAGNDLEAGWYEQGSRFARSKNRFSPSARLQLGDDTLPLGNFRRIKVRLNEPDEILPNASSPEIGTHCLIGIRNHSRVKVEGQIRIPSRTKKHGTSYVIKSIEQLEPQPAIILSPQDEE